MVSYKNLNTHPLFYIIVRYLCFNHDCHDPVQSNSFPCQYICENALRLHSEYMCRDAT